MSVWYSGITNLKKEPGQKAVVLLSCSVAVGGESGCMSKHLGCIRDAIGLGLDIGWTRRNGKTFKRHDRGCLFCLSFPCVIGH